VILISNLTLNIKDGSTIASTSIYGAGKKTYINIGSGNVFKLDWETPVLTNDNIDRYSLVIKRYDPTLNVYYDIFNKNIGRVNEFFVDSPLLPIAPAQYLLSIYLVAYSRLGSIITSNILNPYVSQGGGTYVKVEGDENITYKQPIMKRALGFVNTAQAVTATRAAQIKLLDSDGKILTDINDRVLLCTTPAAKILNRYGVQIHDKEGKALFAAATKLLESTNGWAVVQKGYTKDAEGTWHANDIEYEVLIDSAGEIITDENNEPIYIL
jgi:hypothetical protein